MEQQKCGRSSGKSVFENLLHYFVLCWIIAAGLRWNASPQILLKIKCF